MNEENSARFWREITVEQIEAYLLRVSQNGLSSVPASDRIKLIKAALRTIASGSVENPIRLAANILAVTERNAQPQRNRVAELESIVGEDILRDEKCLFKNAEKIAQHIHLNRTVLRYLYKHSQWNYLSRPDWEARIREANALNYIIRAHFGGARIRNLDFLIDETAMPAAFSKVSPSGPMLLLTFHGGFVTLAWRLFLRTFKNGHILGRGGTIKTKDNRAALFATTRALQENQIVAMAPDGPDGTQGGTLKVLGSTSPVGAGAAYLAYVSGCATAWYAVVRSGNQFLPVVELGPTRGTSESLEEYQLRLNLFYSERVEAAFSGDPGNIVLRPKWTRIFREI